MISEFITPQTREDDWLRLMRITAGSGRLALVKANFWGVLDSYTTQTLPLAIDTKAKPGRLYVSLTVRLLQVAKNGPQIKGAPVLLQYPISSIKYR